MARYKMQHEVNEKVLNAIDSFNIGTDYSVEDLDYCQAQILRGNGYIALRSYHTIVAFIDIDSGNGYDILRYVYGYTASSAKHIAKFRNRFNWSSWYTYRPV